MTRIIEKDGVRIVVIEEEFPGKCEECGKLEELRPYGKNFARICFECAMKNEERSKIMMNKLWSGMREN